MATHEQGSPARSDHGGGDESTNSYEENDGSSNLAFVTYTGRPKRNPATQRKIRKHVMEAVGKAKRGDVPLRPRLLKVSLQVPESSDWSQPNPPSLQSSYRSESTQGSPGSSSTAITVAKFQASYLYPARPSPSTVEKRDGSHSQHRSSESPLEPGRLDEFHGSPSQEPTSIERFGGGRSNSLVKYPIEMNIRAHELVDHIFNDQYSIFKPFRESWFPIGLMDPAAFHQVLANSALSLSILRAGNYSPESYESMTHHSIAIRLVNSRMSDRMFARSDGLIGAVIAFSCYYHTTGQNLKAGIHFAGLKEIIRLRGGPDAPDFNPLVRLVLSWVDIGNCSAEDIRPNYPIAAVLSGRSALDPQIRLLHDCAEQIALCRTALVQNTEIVDIMEDMAKFTLYLESEVSRTDSLVYANTVFCGAYINPLLHRLLSLSSTTPPDTQSSSDLVAEACRLSCILYLAELRRNFGVMLVRSQVQLAKLHLIIENNDDNHIWNGLGTVKLWILALAVVEESEEKQRGWWLEKLKIAAREDGLNSMREVLDALKRFMWMDLHDNIFKPFEQEALEEAGESR